MGEPSASIRPSLGTAASLCLGRYRLIAELGRGGMAEVYLAVVGGPGGFNKLVVIKRIRPQLAEDPDFLNMFLDEARLAARLNHPNIVQTNEVGEESGQYFMAMEYLEGQSLNRVRTRLARSEGLPLAMHLRIIREVLSGLHHAHELADYDGTPLGVVHRDASPSNTFITYAGQVKLVDFGIAKALNSTAETRTGMLKGKVAYMAPEQAQGDPVDRRADVFSAGVMIWEALAGRRLWKDMPEVSVLKWLMESVPNGLPSPRDYNPTVPAILEAVCMRALCPKRDGRHATALELQRELDNAMASLPESFSARDAGEAVARNFADERGQISGIIEQQLHIATALPTDQYRAMQLPQLGPAHMSITPPGVTPTGPSIEQISAIVPTPSQDELEIATDPSRRRFDDSGVPSLPVVPPPEGSTQVSVASSLPAARASKRWLVAAAVGAPLAVLAGGVLAALLMWRGPPVDEAVSVDPPLVSPPAPAAPVPSAAPTASVLAEAADDAEGIVLEVVLVPKDAQLYIDDERVGGDLDEIQLPRDGERHVLRAEADGYETRERQVTFDRNRTIEIELKRSAGGAVAIAEPDPPTEADPTSAPPPPPPPGEPDEDWMKKQWPTAERPIDEDNPYGK